MDLNKCDGTEDIFRAIVSAHYDPQKNRISSSLFTGYGISVSRKQIKNFEETKEIFYAELHSPPKKFLYGIGEININLIQKILSEYNEEFKLQSRVEVIIKPTILNPAHAEINPEEIQINKISKGLSKKIIKNLKIILLTEENN
jgi:hypothetical protein